MTIAKRNASLCLRAKANRLRCGFITIRAGVPAECRKLRLAPCQGADRRPAGFDRLRAGVLAECCKLHASSAQPGREATDRAQREPKTKPSAHRAVDLSPSMPRYGRVDLIAESLPRIVPRRKQVDDAHEFLGEVRRLSGDDHIESTHREGLLFLRG